MSLSDYQKVIDKEQLNQLPQKHYEGEIVVIDTPEALKDAWAEINNCPLCGIDTETLPCFKKGGKQNEVALVQIATDRCVYLIRLNKIGHTQEVTDFFEDPDICKVGISCIDDFRALRRSGSITPQNIIDLNSVCEQLGFESIGAKKLSALILGFSISKKQQTSNWESNTLTQAQCLYAATDAWICREIFLKIQNDIPEKLLLELQKPKQKIEKKAPKSLLGKMDLSNFQFFHRKEIQMRMSDLDAIGHVNNGVQYLYFDLGRVDYLRRISEKTINWKDPELVIVHTECDFKRSILFTDHIFVETKTIEIGTKSIKMLQQIVDKQGVVKSTCFSVLSGFDIKTQTSREISERVKNRIRKFEKIKE